MIPTSSGNASGMNVLKNLLQMGKKDVPVVKQWYKQRPFLHIFAYAGNFETGSH